MASRVPVRTLKRVDLPTLGRPTSAMTGNTTFLTGRYWGGVSAGVSAGGFSTGSDGDGGACRAERAAEASAIGEVLKAVMRPSSLITSTRSPPAATGGLLT